MEHRWDSVYPELTLISTYNDAVYLQTKFEQIWSARPVTAHIFSNKFISNDKLFSW